MYDDISNLKDKFQEDSFVFQDFSSSIPQDIETKVKPIDINEKNKKGNKDSQLNNTVLSEKITIEKTNKKQDVIKQKTSSYQLGSVNTKVKKDNVSKDNLNLLLENKPFDSQKTDKIHANENIALKDILLFIASV